MVLLRPCFYIRGALACFYLLALVARGPRYYWLLALVAGGPMLLLSQCASSRRFYSFLALTPGGPLLLQSPRCGSREPLRPFVSSCCYRGAPCRGPWLACVSLAGYSAVCSLLRCLFSFASVCVSVSLLSVLVLPGGAFPVVQLVVLCLSLSPLSVSISQVLLFPVLRQLLSLLL